MARRMQSLGALTKGDRRAASGQDLSAFDFDTRLGRAALKEMLRTVRASQAGSFAENYTSGREGGSAARGDDSVGGGGGGNGTLARGLPVSELASLASEHRITGSAAHLHSFFVTHEAQRIGHPLRLLAVQ